MNKWNHVYIWSYCLVSLLGGCVTVRTVEEHEAPASDPKIAAIKHALADLHRQFPPKRDTKAVSYLVAIEPGLDIQSLRGTLPKQGKAAATYEVIWSPKTLEEEEDALLIRFENLRGGGLRRTMITRLAWDGHGWQALPFSEDGAFPGRLD